MAAKQVYLPNDLIVSILSRLPSKSLLRFKSVCKSWYSLITHDTVFHTLHVRNSNSNTNGDSLWLAHTWKDGKFYCLYASNFWVYDRKFPCSTKIQPYHVPVELKLPSSVSCLFLHSRIVGWCDGFVAIIQYLANKRTLMCLWNPCIWKHKKVVLPYTTYTRLFPFYGIGLDVESKEYKFVAAHPHSYNEVGYVFVYSLKTGKWTKIDTELKLVSHETYHRGQKFYATYVNGACHWICTDQQRGEDIVLSFNLSDHCFRHIDLPPKSPPCGPGDDYVESFAISVWKDMLSVSETTKTGTLLELNIWVIKDYSNASSCCWTLIKKVNIMENYWGKKGYYPWGIIKEDYSSSSTPFIDSLSNHETQEIQNYLAASLCDLVPFKQSLILPYTRNYYYID